MRDRVANPGRVAAYDSNQRRDPGALAEYTRQRRADPAKYAHDLERSRDRRRLIRRRQAHGLPPPQLRKTTAAERRTSGVTAREFFTRTRTAIDRRNITSEDGPRPTPQQLHDAGRIRAELRNRAEIQQRTTHYLARHGKTKLPEQLRKTLTWSATLECRALVAQWKAQQAAKRRRYTTQRDVTKSVLYSDFVRRRRS